jgi:hypothetical protein
VAASFVGKRANLQTQQQAEIWLLQQDVKWLQHRVQRIVPPPEELAGRMIDWCNRWQNCIDPDSGKQLFDVHCAEMILRAVRHCLEDVYSGACTTALLVVSLMWFLLTHRGMNSCGRALDALSRPCH